MDSMFFEFVWVFCTPLALGAPSLQICVVMAPLVTEPPPQRSRAPMRSYSGSCAANMCAGFVLGSWLPLLCVMHRSAYRTDFRVFLNFTRH